MCRLEKVMCFVVNSVDGCVGTQGGKSCHCTKETLTMKKKVVLGI